MDIDVALAPEPGGFFSAVEQAKRNLKIAVDLAAPNLYVPLLPGWQARSSYIKSVNQVDFYSFDFYCQAFAKISRGHAGDLADVAAMVAAAEIEPVQLRLFVAEVAPFLIRFPNLQKKALLERVDVWAAGEGQFKGRLQKSYSGIRSADSSLDCAGLADVPGCALISAGLKDIEKNRQTVAAFAVCVALPRLRGLNLRFPVAMLLPSDPEMALYRSLVAKYDHDAHRRFHAIRRDLVSFAEACDIRLLTT